MNNIATARTPKKRRRRNTDQISVSPTTQSIIDDFDSLELNSQGLIDGGEDFVFVEMEFDDELELPSELPYILNEQQTKLYVFISPTHELDDTFSQYAEPLLDPSDIGEYPTHFDPEGDEWPTNERVNNILRSIRSSLFELKQMRNATDVLERANGPYSDLFAGNLTISAETPMLVEGFMSEGGVAVVYGSLDEFKTTVVMDMMMHVSVGCPWQGREVYPRPVIWYALEQKEEALVRVRALQDRLKNKDTSWGDYPAPISVKDRIPDNLTDWRSEIKSIGDEFRKVYGARETCDTLPTRERTTDAGEKFNRVRYPDIYDFQPVVVVDTFSQWLGGEDEKGAKAVERISQALDLLKDRPDLGAPHDNDGAREWRAENPDQDPDLDCPVASQVILIHHPTKSGEDFAGHRAIAADTQSLYRVKRFGNLKDNNRSMAGIITPIRTKDMTKPVPIRFETEVVHVPETARTTVCLKEKGIDVPKALEPIIEALREFGDQAELNGEELNQCIDVTANNRASRGRYRKRLIDCGALEPIEDEDGRTIGHRFHEPG